MALVNTHTGPTKTFVSPNRRDDLMYEQLDYTRLATEREAALAELEAKQASLFRMERAEEQARTLRQAHMERQMFDQETKMQERLHSDHMRALALEDRKMRFRDQQAQEHERMLHARRSATELRLKADDERRRAEFEAYRAGMRAGHHHSPLRPRHHSGYLPPSGASHLLHPPSTHHLRPSPPYQSRPPHQPPLLMPPPGPSPPHYHRRSSSMAGLDPPPAFRGHHRPTGSIPGTPRHPPPLTSLHPPATPRQRRISDPGLGLRTSHRF